MAFSIISTRPLTAADLDACMRIERAAFKRHEWCSRELFERCLKESPEICFGIFSGRLLVGHAISRRSQHPTFTDSCMDASLWRPDGPTVALLSFAVLPDFQNKGFGTILMDAYVRNLSASQKMERTRKNSRPPPPPPKRIALIARERLLRFYRRFGFMNEGKSQVKFGGGGWLDVVLKF